MSRAAIWLIVAALLAGGPAVAGPVDDGLRCLVANDLPCAQSIVSEQRARGATGADLDLLEGRVRFHEGASEEAAELLTKALEAHPDDEQLQRERALAEDTARISEGLVETTRDGITVLHHPGVDRVLVDGTIEALSAARERIAPLLGGTSPVPVRVEIYPTGASFVVASGLPAEAVATTGVIAISKWHRILITSPRATGRGYSWQDTIVHEWIHLVVSWQTQEQAPIWLQEGLAKSLDSLWRADHFTLPVPAQSALARAIRDDDFVSFEEMHPSMAFLPSAERTTLAYAQVSTMIDFLRREEGDGALIDVLERVRGGGDARDAVAQVYNGGDFAGFESDWRAYLETLDLIQDSLETLPVVLDGAGEELDIDPALAARQDLAGKVRLGDLMAQRGHPEAALIYYEQAEPEGEPMGPVLSLHTARALVALDRDAEARALLEDNLVYYSEYAANHQLLAEILLRAGQPGPATEHFLKAAAINPYPIEVQQALVALYEQSGEATLAERHRSTLDILMYRDTP